MNWTKTALRPGEVMSDELKKVALVGELYTGCVYALNELENPHSNKENRKETIEYLKGAIADAKAQGVE